MGNPGTRYFQMAVGRNQGPMVESHACCLIRSFRGFSLVELMIAGFIFMTGGLCILSLLAFAVSVNLRARLESAALHLSELKMEELKALSFSDPKLTAPGCAMNGNFEIEFSGPADSAHSSQTSFPLAFSPSSVIGFETRWHVEDYSGKKMIIVATSPTPSSQLKLRPANLRLLRCL